MKITWSDNKNIGRVDTNSLSTKPIFSFTYEYLNIDNGVSEYTPKERANYPELVDIPEATMIAEYVNRPLSDTQLAEVTAFYNSYPREPETMPVYDGATQKIIEDGTEVIDGLTYKKYIVTPLTQAELDANFKATVPDVISMRQARLALLGAGLLATAESAIANGTDEAMKIEWEYATEVRRDWESLITMATALGISEEGLDNLFIAGGEL